MFIKIEKLKYIKKIYTICIHDVYELVIFYMNSFFCYALTLRPFANRHTVNRGGIIIPRSNQNLLNFAPRKKEG